MLKMVKYILFCLSLLSFSQWANASLCEDIYNKIQKHGCGILKKAPQAKKICDLANGGSEKLCKWCMEHQSICIAVGSIIFSYGPDNACIHPLACTKSN